eukprot:CAMPEP_0182425178 /NCGR_PEP_ID=MMETSP1167-20130531/11530_1 /TAXON_ID=2988 /ORGANISM="Mallomonas Sp, Strain CCMP3275" /LENGTH=399 /DNA_ID=CAMNT_0024605625 /DNA_START=439 /DNA_END=1635 /DNA_ORIENTATION=+
MRGCVAAGATAALNFLGLDDSLDVVYGSSAGAMIGAYFISRQVSGVAIYHDLIPAAGRFFVNKFKLLHAIGLSVRFPWLLPSRAAIWSDRYSVLNLAFLLDMVMGSIQPLDWVTFSKNQETQPLKIVASSMRSLRPVVLTREGQHYNSLTSLLECIRASMLVPGICGQLMGIRAGETIPMMVERLTEAGARDKTARRFATHTPDDTLQDQRHEVEPLVDALLCEPIPFRSAVYDNCTHVLVLRTRPDPCPMLGTGPGLYERFIANRFFAFHSASAAAEHVLHQRHQIIYAEDVLLLNDASHGNEEGVVIDNKKVYMLPVAPNSDCLEVSQLESGKRPLLNGMRDGARRVIEIFGPSLGVTGADIENAVMTIFPDSILDRPQLLELYTNSVILESGRINT